MKRFSIALGVAVLLAVPAAAMAQSGPYGLPGSSTTYNSMGTYGAMPGEGYGSSAPQPGYDPEPLGPVWMPSDVPMQGNSGLNTSPYPYGVQSTPYGSGPPDPWR